MSGNCARDNHGVTHRVLGEPAVFSTIPGGMPGHVACGPRFFVRARGRTSCSFPNVVPMDPVDGSVDCMACLVAECRR